MNLKNIAYSIIILLGIGFLLIYLKSILIPFVFALLIWFIIRDIKDRLNQNKIIRKKFPNWLINTLSLFIIFFILGIVVLLVVENVKEMITNGEEYQQKYYALINLLYTEYNINLKEEGIKLLNQYNLTASLKGLINAFSTSLGNVFLVLIYVLFLVAEESTFTAKIKAISSSREKYVSTLKTLKSINSTIGKYIALKTSVSLITGLLTLIVLSILKVDYPLFWAMLVFFFNYIPNIGSIIATIFPSVMALIQFDSLTMFLVVLASISVIQIIIGNFVEPKIMGDSLNISPLVVILALVFWGFLWGITGMIICVPLTVILIIVLSKFPMTRNIAVILSEKGKV